jgi:hypothetical protein
MSDRADDVGDGIPVRFSVSSRYNDLPRPFGLLLLTTIPCSSMRPPIGGVRCEDGAVRCHGEGDGSNG